MQLRSRARRARRSGRRMLVLALSALIACSVALMRPDAAHAAVLLADGFEGTPQNRWTLQSSGSAVVGFDTGSAHSGTKYAYMDFYSSDSWARVFRRFTLPSMPGSVCYPEVYMRAVAGSRVLMLYVVVPGDGPILASSTVEVSSKGYERYGFGAFDWRGDSLFIGFQSPDRVGSVGSISIDDVAVSCVNPPR